jgi:hypothetical protein
MVTVEVAAGGKKGRRLRVLKPIAGLRASEERE